MDTAKLSRDFSKEPLIKGEKPTKEDLKYMYLDCNMSRAEIAAFIGKSEAQTKKYLAEYKFQKTQKQKTEIRKRTILAKYGVENVSQLKEVKDKKEQKALEKYGVKNVFASEEIKNKIKQTNLEKYKHENPAQNPDIYLKIINTNMQKYGYKNPAQNEDVKEKMKATCLARYGRDNILLCNYSDETLAIVQSKDKFEEFLKSSKKKWTTRTIADKLKISLSNVQKLIHKYEVENYIDYYTSSYELELQSLFPHMHKTKSVIYPYEIDLYSEEHKFGIEFNGNYWHSEIKLNDFKYHQKKSLVAEDAGIFLYHIWEYEWQDPVKKEKIIAQINNILGKNEKRVYARDCYVKEIRRETAEVFINEYHMQGYAPDSIRFGLYEGVELLSVMTFGKPRFDKSCEYELIRYCCKKNVSVIGGASKLFKHFIKEYNPNNILSYSHIDKGTGKLYEKLGFTLDKITNPDYIWCDGENILSRYQCQKHKLNKMGFEGSEREIMENLGFFRIFGCGNKVWIWKKICM